MFDCIIKREVSSVDSFKKIQNASKFEKLTHKDNNAKTFRNLVVLPPHLVTAFLSISSRKPSDLACVARAAAESFKNEHGSYKDFDEDDHHAALNCILSFLWYCSKSALDPPKFSASADATLPSWC